MTSINFRQPPNQRGAIFSGEKVAGLRVRNPAPYQKNEIIDLVKRLWISLALTVPIMVLSPATQPFPSETARFPGDTYVIFVLGSGIYLIGGYQIIRGFLREVWDHTPGIMTLATLVMSTVYAYSAAVVFGLRGELLFWEMAVLVDIMLLARWMEMSLRAKAPRPLGAIASLMPAVAHKFHNGQGILNTPVSTLSRGSRIIVRAGETVPTDGKVISGESSAEEEHLTGESQPVAKEAGDTVIGGSRNREGALIIEVQRTGPDSYFSRITELAKASLSSISRSQSAADKTAFALTILALIAGTASFVVWLLIEQCSIGFALERAAAVLAAASPISFSLAVALVISAATYLALGRGILIRSQGVFAEARKVRAVVFSKTGILTYGQFGVTDVVSLHRDHSPNGLMVYAASLEEKSRHAIGRAIAASAKERLPVTDFKNIPGAGVTGTVAGRQVTVISLAHAEAHGIDTASPLLKHLIDQAKTLVLVIIDRSLAGAIALADVIRPESREAVRKLQAMSIKCIMLTGDNRRVALTVARHVGLDEYFAEVSPEEKASRVKEIQARYGTTAMAGERVSEATALAQADLSIEVGAGTEIAAHTGHIVLIRSSPLDIAEALHLARAAHKKVIQNLVLAFAYNLITIPLAAGLIFHDSISLSPVTGALMMAASVAIIGLNSNLLRLYRRNGPEESRRRANNLSEEYSKLTFKI